MRRFKFGKGRDITRGNTPMVWVTWFWRYHNFTLCLRPLLWRLDWFFPVPGKPASDRVYLGPIEFQWTNWLRLRKESGDA